MKLKVPRVSPFTRMFRRRLQVKTKLKPFIPCTLPARALLIYCNVGCHDTVSKDGHDVPIPFSSDRGCRPGILRSKTQLVAAIPSTLSYYSWVMISPIPTQETGKFIRSTSPSLMKLLTAGVVLTHVAFVFFCASSEPDCVGRTLSRSTPHHEITAGHYDRYSEGISGCASECVAACCSPCNIRARRRSTSRRWRRRRWRGYAARFGKRR